MNDIIISICCAAYNHVRYIDKAIESFLMQKTNYEFEIIIHDDASTDGTADAILSWQKQYPDKIQTIIQIENQYSKGVSIIDTMLLRARGKYIAICEGDDYWTSEDKLEKQTRYMETHLDCSFCIHASSIVNEAGKQTGILRKYRHDCDIDMKDILIFGGGLAATSSYFYPKALRIDGLPEFCRKVPGVGDNSLQLFLATKGKVHYLSSDMSCYRRGHTGSWTARTFHSGDAARIPYLRASIDMYHSFDEYTGGRWHNEVEHVVLTKELNILQSRHDFSLIFHPPYQKVFWKIGVLNQIKICVKFALYKISPQCYEKLLTKKRLF